MLNVVVVVEVPADIVEEPAFSIPPLFMVSAPVPVNVDEPAFTVPVMLIVLAASVKPAVSVAVVATVSAPQLIADAPDEVITPPAFTVITPAPLFGVIFPLFKLSVPVMDADDGARNAVLAFMVPPEERVNVVQLIVPLPPFTMPPLLTVKVLEPVKVAEFKFSVPVIDVVVTDRLEPLQVRVPPVPTVSAVGDTA
jgi:hypothetical protein